MQVVAGLSLKNLEPRVWDPASPYYLLDLTAVMVSYGDFQQMPAKRRAAMREGLREYLGVPEGVCIYLDNGAFYFASKGGEPGAREYREFVRRANPDWRPVRFDAIPAPQMSWQKQLACYARTMEMNRRYQHDGYVPVVHAGRYLGKYLEAIESVPRLAAKECIALGALVPNLLRSPRAATYSSILGDLIAVRDRFPKKRIHVFGIGGTATVHLAALLGFDSADSSGWRNRAARGIIQLAGSGERIVAELGNWRGRRPTEEEWAELERCGCPGCQQFGVRSLKASGIDGFAHRATHNLWILLKEARWVSERLAKGTYSRCYRRRLDNTVYLPLISEVLKLRRLPEKSRAARSS
jgi:7-cyano-7-deazaguanine tRNA-ribosyltransferase